LIQIKFLNCNCRKIVQLSDFLNKFLLRLRLINSIVQPIKWPRCGSTRISGGITPILSAFVLATGL